jgi:hypothetical protein
MRDEQLIDSLRDQVCSHYARTTTIGKLPTLLRRVASDLDRLPPHMVLGVTIEMSHRLDEATVTVYLDLSDDDRAPREA